MNSETGFSCRAPGPVAARHCQRIRACGAPPPWPISSGFALDSPLEQEGFELPVSARTAVACPPISLHCSSTKTTSRVRGSRACFGQLTDQKLRSGFGSRAGSSGFGKPINLRSNSTSNIFY